MLVFQSFEVTLGVELTCAQSTLTGIELIHMLRKGQLEDGVEQGLKRSRSVLLPRLIVTSPNGPHSPQIIDASIFVTEPPMSAKSCSGIHAPNPYWVNN